MEVVRYERAGKWYLEPPTHLGLQRQHVKISGAAQYAQWIAANGGAVFFGLPGGSAFDAQVRKVQR
jgi:hypothetical protein